MVEAPPTYVNLKLTLLHQGAFWVSSQAVQLTQHRRMLPASRRCQSSLSWTLLTRTEPRGHPLVHLPYHGPKKAELSPVPPWTVKNIRTMRGLRKRGTAFFFILNKKYFMGHVFKPLEMRTIITFKSSSPVLFLTLQSQNIIT